MSRAYPDGLSFVARFKVKITKIRPSGHDMVAYTAKFRHILDKLIEENPCVIRCQDGRIAYEW